MKAAILERPGRLRIVEQPEPRAGAGSVLVRIGLCGVCGTDLLIVDGRVKVELPYRNLGHEYVGVVAEVGAGVRSAATGDRVVINPNYHCDACPACRRGEPGFCENRRAFATKSNGGFAQYACVAEKHVHPVPAGLADEAAIFAEPLSCCLHAVERAGLQAGDDVLIFGCGTMGLLVLQLCRLLGAGRILVSEPVASRRSAAERFGADLAVDPASTDLAGAVLGLMPRGPRVVVETAGARGTLAEGVRLIAPRGRFLLIASWEEAFETPVAPELLVSKEVSLVGSVFGHEALSRSLELLAAGTVRTEGMLSAVHALDDLELAVREACGREAIKVAVRTS